MANGVGSILREARNRRKVDLSTVEEATRIRVRFLRALENEEWDVLPGGVYTRGFIRTYATYLGLDGERLAEDFRREVEGAEARPMGSEPAPIAASRPQGSRDGARLLPAAGWIAVAAVIGVAVVVIVLLPGGGGGGRGGHAARQSGNGVRAAVEKPKAQPERKGVSVRLSARAEVWVCVLDAKGAQVVDGQILEAGAEEGPFRSGSFTVSFGNGEVSMTIDGKTADLPATSSPIGYSIDGSGAFTELSESERPTCA
jgi:hypothetical protein